VQARGLEAAIANLNGYEKQIATVWGTFYKHYTEQHGQHQALLDSFPSDVEKVCNLFAERTSPVAPYC